MHCDIRVFACGMGSKTNRISFHFKGWEFFSGSIELESGRNYDYYLFFWRRLNEVER
jgi:hypothetical protein